MNRGTAIRAIATAGAAALFAVGAQAQTTEAVTAEELAAALTAAGLASSMIEDTATGAPVAQGTLGSLTFFVRALDCTGAPKACENLVFFANFDLGRAPTQQDFRIVNGFNDRQLFGRAYILESKGEVGVEYVIELGGGVTKAHLAKNIGRWADIVAAFIDSFQAQPGTS